MAGLTKEDVINFISNMTVMELSEMVKELEEKFGVSAAAPMPMMFAGAGPAEAEKKEEEQTEFTVHLTGIGDQKIQVIKEVRALTGLGLKEAKELVDNAPKPLKEHVSKEEAEKMKAAIEKVGGSVEIK
ncbi:MAG: 50S ribosomal protein L7/L12 [bacterium]